MRTALKNHWPEYLIEAWALGTFMISACLFTALLEHPSSPLRHAIPSDFARRGVIGLAMGLTAIFLIYSPWGKRSGAHMNPSVTLAFWRLGKMPSEDALFYMIFQFIGGYAGVWVSALLVGPAIAHPAVAYAVTIPGAGGAAEAWWAEFIISFLLMGTILVVSNDPKRMGWTGICAGALIALYVLFEAPLSGMSMNPARTLGSAVPARIFDHLWIYFTAPLAGMFLAAEIYMSAAGSCLCAKLIHSPRERCIFCGQKSLTLGFAGPSPTGRGR